jgi:hypothetical protein
VLVVGTLLDLRPASSRSRAATQGRPSLFVIRPTLVSISSAPTCNACRCHSSLHSWPQLQIPDLECLCHICLVCFGVDLRASAHYMDEIASKVQHKNL